jgi:uncharacterized membrane protein YdjX (TVP38/TMEM64 family)
LNLIFANKKTLIVLGGLTVLQVVCTSAVVAYSVQAQATLAQFSLAEWSLVYALASVLVAFSVIPNTFLAFLGGYFLVFWSIPFMLLTYLAALLMSYAIARQLDGGTFWQSLSQHPRIQLTINQLQKQETWLVFFARLSPLLPFVVMNQVLYSLQVSKRQYFIGSILGMTPRMLLLTWAGSTAASVDWQKINENPVTLSIQVFLLVFSTFGIGFLIRKVQKSV